MQLCFIASAKEENTARIFVALLQNRIRNKGEWRQQMTHSFKTPIIILDYRSASASSSLSYFKSDCNSPSARCSLIFIVTVSVLLVIALLPSLF
jgi:hypothetical protein